MRLPGIITHLTIEPTRSSVVEKVLIHAHKEGRRISVIVVDSRPMLEGLLSHSYI